MKSRRHSPGARTAFTLIELLVVVAIIALLISILLPALGGARKQARQLLCSTNLRTMGQAALLYAAEFNDVIVRGETREPYPLAPGDSSLHFVCCLLRGLGYDGKISELWSVNFASQITFRNVCRSMKILQCPDFPVPQQDLDYVVNSMPIPYTQKNYSRDTQGAAGDEYLFESILNYDVSEYFRITDFKRASPAQLIYITEAHKSLPQADFIFHDFFLASQIPFGRGPRTSNDKRHPGGINALFFDGHAETMGFHRIDPGWPTSVGQRLRFFTVMPPGLE